MASDDLQLDPAEFNEYHGICMRKDQEWIPISLAREITRLGYVNLWQYQHFCHHDHPSFDEEPIASELLWVDHHLAVLTERFPDFPLIIEVAPMDRATWYQIVGDAPTEPFEPWARYRPHFVPKDHVGEIPLACEGCGEYGKMSDPQEHERHPGIQLVTCSSCAHKQIYATRIVRFRLGPSTPEGS